MRGCFKGFFLRTQLFLCVFLLFLVCPKLKATTLEPLSLRDLTQRAWLVAYGQIEDLKVDLVSGRRTASFRADEVFHVARGVLGRLGPQENLYPIALQGRVFPRQNLREYIPLSADFHKGEKVVVFLSSDSLEANRAKEFRVVGMIQGKFFVEEGEGGVKKVLHWLEQTDVYPDPLLKNLREAAPRGALAPSEPRQSPKTLETFRQEIHRIKQELNL